MYEDGNIGLEATTLDITPDSKRVAIIGLNGAGKTTLLKLLDGALTATSGTARIEADGTAYDPAVKRDLKHVEDLVGRVRREEIPNAYYKAASIREAIDLPLKKHKVPESERQAIIGNLFAHFDLASVAREPASALDSEKRHLLAIAAALSFSPLRSSPTSRPRDWTRCRRRAWRRPCSAMTSRWCSPRMTRI